MTKILVANFKDAIKKAEMSKFDQDIKRFDTWFLDKQSNTVKEVGEAGCTEYMGCLFKTYHIYTDKQFRTLIAKQRRKWMMDKLPSSYNYSNLIDFTTKTIDNQVALKEWTGSKEGNKEKKPVVLLTNDFNKNQQFHCIFWKFYLNV